MSDELEAAQGEALKRYENNYPRYAKQCLFIRQKDGQTVPLAFNRSQAYLHQKIEAQRAATGMVRVLVLKSRQVGISTYFTGRTYYKTTFHKGQKAFVITQEDDTTNALFGMVKRFHENTPEFVRPQVGASNSKELIFSRLDSGYLVSTAGNKNTGRGQTIQIFHGSETSRWPNAEEHVAGVMRSIPLLPGTEVYLESTANGVNNYFHKMWSAAVKGEGDFIHVFIPWFWHEEYTREVEPKDWKPPIAFAEYQKLYDLTREQTFWAYRTNMDMAQATGAPTSEICWLFRQEFPANAEEAFSSAKQSNFIRGDLVQAARKRSVTPRGPIILGVDVARGGEDKSAIIDRQGRRLGFNVCKKFNYGKDTTPLIGDVINIVREMRMNSTPIAKIVVDATGVGGPVFDILRERLGEKLVEGIEFGGAPLNRDRFANRRAEIWHDLMQAFQAKEGFQCVDSDDLQQDLCAPAWKDPTEKGQNQMTRYRTDGCLIIEDKDHIRKRLGFSPDFGDAAALTFAVNFDELMEHIMVGSPAYTGEGAWML